MSQRNVISGSDVVYDQFGYHENLELSLYFSCHFIFSCLYLADYAHIMAELKYKAMKILGICHLIQIN